MTMLVTDDCVNEADSIEVGAAYEACILMVESVTPIDVVRIADEEDDDDDEAGVADNNVDIADAVYVEMREIDDEAAEEDDNDEAVDAVVSNAWAVAAS